MPELQLFRMKVYPSKERSLYEDSPKPQDILLRTIEALPSAELRKNIIWHLGNILPLDDNSIYFKFGKSTKSKMGVYQDKNFDDKEIEIAPYTHVILDYSLEVCAIAKQIELAPKTSGIAKQLVKLLNNSERNLKDIKAKFEISEINDPEDFLKYILSAYSVSKFWIEFSRPNPWDVNEDFWKPMEKLLKEVGGDKGRTELAGEKLSVVELEDLARTAASIGNDASAQLQETQSSKRVRKHLKGNPIAINIDNIDKMEDKMTLLKKIRDLYQHVRKKG